MKLFNLLACLTLSVALAGQATADTLGFSIDLIYNDVPTAAEQAAFDGAASVWESLITGFQDTIGDTVLEIEVNLEPIDGEFNVLGSAGPTTVKAGSEANFLYAGSGRMTFDTADTARLANNGSLDDVILHEMGHVLGIGTLWSSSGVGIPGFQELYVNNSGQYTGAFGVAAYNAEFGQAGAFIPVELAGGQGTANGHWNEVDGGGGLTGITDGFGNDFRNELMTGWLDAPTFISNTTIESMRDLGYNVITEVVPGPSVFVATAALFAARRRRRKA